MDLSEIKEKFKHRISADIQDLDFVLKAAPFLVREVERLEKELKEYEKRIEHLQLQLKKRPPLAKKGKKGAAGWDARVDEDKNRLYFKLSGRFDYSSAKVSSNSIMSVLPNLREDFDAIGDILELEADFDKKALFHFKKFMYMLNDMGLKRVICVSTLNFPLLFSVFNDKSKMIGYQAQTVNTVAEAETMLDNIGRFLKA